MGKPIKIAVVIGTLDRGGAERDIVRNFPLLDRERFEVVAIAFNEPGALAPELEAAGVRVVSRHVPRPRTPGPWIARRARDVVYALGLVPWIGRTYRSEAPDIAHFFLPYSYAFGALAARLYRRHIPLVMSRLSLNFYAADHRILSWLERSVLHRWVRVAIANSALIVEELEREGVAAPKIRLVHNGIDVDALVATPELRERGRAELGVAGDAFVMLSVGNLHRYKGHEDLIRACAAVRDELPRGWRLVIVGRDERDNRASYEALAGELGLGPHVWFAGERHDVEAFFAAADLFVHPSHHEGLPNAVLEAMSFSLPVVATNVGGVPEAVVGADGVSGQRCGWLVEPRDPGALARALVEAAGDGDGRTVFGSRARARAIRDFSLAASVAALEEIYGGLVRSDSKP